MRVVGKAMLFDSPPVIAGSAGVAGKKESEGPLGADFDETYQESLLGCESFELAEALMQQNCIMRACANAGAAAGDVQLIISGDLLDQCMASAFAVKGLAVPFAGVYGACSTMALSLALGCVIIDCGASCVACAASSHFCSSERQFRFPLEYGGQRPPTSQWTVTGAGCAVLKNEEAAAGGVRITAALLGTVRDLGIKDANNMGAAMAPAAASTVYEFLKSTDTAAQDYDLILTGDLGFTGSELLYELMEKEHGVDIRGVHNDCGMMIFDREAQDVNSGGSGCGCSASVLCSHIIKKMKAGALKKVLFTATGALMSPTSSKQGQTIPGVAHAVLLEV